ncbi:hypothetical protein R4172_05020 [Rhodococcus kroppenstedtii]|uniref:Uncharacterized protein n=1 Tax=Rhodococcoides kroppenstedtii TaxID=293050 RepID=A0A1I0TYG8_9NOCA|nr:MULTISPECIES: hypothetical protein [Rhodococcus]MBY6348718.1 hypothetical protein [Rhodococcus corynebacterioides]MBY6361875.1 hypothetical protein [Rhodococcus corynebacterioides]MDV7196922.1 hypothetical protein [Rhodococcus kroppenstedtii]NIL81240.1 hypothetical protein [Rhodococcus kroppenstedtii]SFA56822.1 hypothetical protein SAMN05444374_11110 [Rhodococcus kroppenstedtii]
MPPPRERVVLATRRGARIVRTRVEVEEQTAVGEAMVRGLIRAQLALALRMAAVVVLLVGLIPLLWVVAPAAGTARLWGVGVPWWILAVAAYPVLLAVGVAFVRAAGRNEQEFADLVDDRWP